MHKAYFAGFFDGEGCIRIDRIKAKKGKYTYTRYQLKAGLSQCDPQPLVNLQHAYGGWLSRIKKPSNPKHRAVFQWSVCSGFASAFLKDIRPYLVVKAQEADIAIEFYRKMKELDFHFRSHRGNPPDKPAILAERETVIELLRSLKRREFPAELPSAMALTTD